MFQKNQGVKKAIVLYVTAILGFLILLPNGTANAHAQTAGQQQTLLYMGILLLLVILIVGWALLRKGKTR